MAATERFFARRGAIFVAGARFIDGLHQGQRDRCRGGPHGLVARLGSVGRPVVALLIRWLGPNGDPGTTRKRKKHKTSRAPRIDAPLTLKSPSGFASAMSSSRSGPRPVPPSLPEFETLLYSTAGPVATITLNRPEHLNTIVPPMPDEIEAAVGLAERDRDIKVIVLRGAGRAFSGGYDFGGGFQHWGEAMMTAGKWDPGKDFAMVTARETGPTQKFMAIWRASKPVIAQVHGWCVGGASDYALCADIVIASEDAVIGTPYSRMWGAYLTGMWLYRLSLAKVKWHALTGRPLTGVQAAEVELINEAVPFERLEARVAEIATELARIPLSQLQAQKLIVNQAYENMGLASTQTLGGILDGLMRNTPEALDFITTAETQGVRAAVERRDGPFGDYSQAPPELRPDPNHIIVPDGNG